MERSILEEALEVSLGRGREYGPPDKNFEAIAELWNAYLTNKVRQRENPWLDENPFLDEVDYAVMMALAKVGRMQTGEPDRDTLVDIAGYIRSAAEIMGFERLDYEAGRADELAVGLDTYEGGVTMSLDVGTGEMLVGRGEDLSAACADLTEKLEDYEADG